MTESDRVQTQQQQLPLLLLRTQLQEQLAQLQTDLVELINRDYDDFISLSANLHGMDRRLAAMFEDLRAADRAYQVRAAGIGKVESSWKNADLKGNRRVHRRFDRGRGGRAGGEAGGPGGNGASHAHML